MSLRAFHQARWQRIATRYQRERKLLLVLCAIGFGVPFVTAVLERELPWPRAVVLAIEIGAGTVALMFGVYLALQIVRYAIPDSWLRAWRGLPEGWRRWLPWWGVVLWSALAFTRALVASGVPPWGWLVGLVALYVAGALLVLYLGVRVVRLAWGTGGSSSADARLTQQLTEQNQLLKAMLRAAQEQIESLREEIAHLRKTRA